MRHFAYADPPYLGCSSMYPEHPESAKYDDPEAHGELDQVGVFVSTVGDPQGVRHFCSRRCVGEWGQVDEFDGIPVSVAVPSHSSPSVPEVSK